MGKKDFGAGKEKEQLRAGYGCGNSSRRTITDHCASVSRACPRAVATPCPDCRDDRSCRWPSMSAQFDEEVSAGEVHRRGPEGMDPKTQRKNATPRPEQTLPPPPPPR